MTFKELRIEAGYNTRKDLAFALGTKRFNIDKWESGVAMPRSRNLKMVANALGVSVETILDCFKEENLDKTEE